jgi:hypothetical protein
MKPLSRNLRERVPSEARRVRAFVHATLTHPHPPIAGAMGPSLSHFVGEGFIAPSPATCGRGCPKRSEGRVRAFDAGDPHPPIAGAMGPSLSHFVGEGFIAPSPAERRAGEGFSGGRLRRCG